jgi:hypothetical protein
VHGPSTPLFVRFAYDLGRARRTGEIVATQRGVRLDAIVILGGAALTPELDALGRQIGERLTRLAALPHASFAFYPGRACADGRRVSLAGWARRSMERQLDAEGARALATELRDRRLTLRHECVPERDALDALDVALVSLLATPRTIGELSSLTRLPSFRVLAFVHFLRCVGALAIADAEGSFRAAPDSERGIEHGTVRASAFERLGVPRGASDDLVKRAFRRLARTLHPDLHPGAGEAERRSLERRLAEVNAAYGELMAEAS